jgi:WD40 repeat protein/class 3 adenylate cyclase
VAAVADLLRERYELLEVLGEGGEGRVVKALDHQHDRLVALKIRTVGPAVDREALLAEARVLLAIPPHPHVPLVRDDFFDGDQYVIAMDWVEGSDLGRLLHTRGRPGLGPSVVLPWLADAAAALTHLHAQHPPVVHGDVKPANLVLTDSGRVVLVDFGLSSSPTSSRRRTGTRGFAAPEIAAGGEPSRASDVYSLAATAFTLLTGEPPSGVRPAWDGIDPVQAAELEEAIRLGLSTDPAKRPESAGELVERLRAGWHDSLPTGVLTFCLTDIVGSTSKWETRPGDMARALAVHDDIVAAAAERHGGRFLEAQGEGDSTLTMYPAPGAAVSAAIDIVNSLATATWPGDLRLAVRVGIHTGETAWRRGDYVGATVNMAARLRGLGDAEEILVSHVTAELVRHHLPDGVGLVPLGPHRLRGVREREEVFAIAAPGVHTPPPPSECPYPGLLSFTAGDADRFFGREAVVADIVARLDAHPFLAVVGASGSGKSSVLRAGVAPVLGIDEVVTPGTRPCAALDSIDGPAIVDQFEELFSHSVGEEERAAFLDRLLAWPHAVVIGLRADFYGACAQHAGLADAVARHQVLLGPMSTDELERAITEPAARAGLRIEPGLVDVLVTKVAGEPGALPLLSHALRSTWEVRDGRTLTLEGYASTGGVEGAIAATADGAVDGLDRDDQVLARRLFVRLVEPGDGAPDTRRRAGVSELLPADGDEGRMERVLDTVVDARLVTMDDTGVEVAHEALIREWPRLQSWLDEDRDGLRLQRHLTASATAWEQLGRDPGELYRGQRLAAVGEWLAADPPLSALEREFVDESRVVEERAVADQARTNRRLRRRVTYIAVALVVALVAAGAAFVQGRRATSERDRAEVSRIAAVSRSLTERQPAVGLLLAAEAYRRRDDSDTRSTLLAALETHPLLAGLLYGEESGFEATVFTPDGELLATPTSDGAGTILWDTESRTRVDVLRDGDDILLDAAVSPDGRWLAVPAVSETPAGPFGRLQIWDLSTRTLDRVVDSPGGVLSTAAFTADGTRLVTQGGPRNAPDFPLLAVVWDTATWGPVGDPWVLDPTYVGDDVVTVSPDGRRLANVTPDGAVQVWTVDDRRPLGEPLRPDDVGFATATAFSPGGTLAIAGDTSRVVLVHPVTGEEQPAMRLPDGEPMAAEFSPDGTVLAVGNSDGKTQLFDVATRQELGPALAASSSGINDVSFSRDGDLLATGSLDRTGALWRLDADRSIAEVASDHDAQVTEVAYTSDGRFLASSGADGHLVIRDLEEQTKRTVDVGGEVLSVAVDPTDRWVVTGGTTGRVQLFDVRTGEPGPSLALDEAWIYQVAFDPTSGAIAAAVEVARGGAPGFVVVWDPETEREVGARIRFPIGGTPIGVTWSPDGAQLAVIADNNLVHVYEARGRHAELGEPIESVDAPFLAAAFSPDRTRLATGNSAGVVQQWSTETHEPVGPALRGHTGPVGGVAYSPDGTTLASTTLGFSRSRLWDAETGASIGAELVGARTPITFSGFLLEHYQGSRPAFAPDGRHLAIPSFDGTTAIWDLRPSRWLDAACDLVGRDLTREEWRQHMGSASYRSTCD